MYPISLKYNVNLVKHLRLLLCICALLALRQSVMAQEQEPYVQTITGSIKAGDSCRTIDPVYADEETWQKRETDLSVKNIITFELRQDTGLYYYGRPFSCTVNLDISYEDEQRGSHQLSGKVLTVNFDTTAGGAYKGVAMYKFEGGYNVLVKVNSIASPELGGQDSLPAVFRIKNEIFIDRKFLFSTANGDVTRYAFVNGGRQLKINWLVDYDYPGAEFYDLEWTFYDDSSSVAAGIRTAHTPEQLGNRELNMPQADMEALFLNNNTRITTTGREYALNLPYISGFLFYRVRGARINAFTQEREEGDWTYKAYSPGNTVVSSIVHLDADHAPLLNYQYTATFAEEGKRKEVITYYDGSLRNRQMVTLNNSDNRSVVQETIYDVMGRPALNILPSPEPDSSLHYFPSLNRNLAGQPYTYKDLTNDTAACVMAPQQLTDTAGAGRYYSPNNPHNNYFFNKYIPDAAGYPFSATAYTTDNTGRISRQGGAGVDFQPGNGHETRYFYGRPDALELDRLFGSEAGNASHYLKNMVVDPNGQISVSYLDAHGRTVATALAGKKPDNVYELPGTAGSITPITKELALPENTAVNPAAFTVTSNNTLLIPLTGTYHFEYSFDPQAVITAACETQFGDICSDCYYDLLITIKDECGISLHEEVKPAVLDGIDTLCSTLALQVSGAFDVDLPIGEYQVSYQLRASKTAAEYYDSTYLRQNTCIMSLDDFKRQQVAQTDFTGCFTDCAACEQALGTKNVFLRQYMDLLKEQDLYPNNGDTLFAADLYDSLYVSCTQKCVSGINPCADKYGLLLTDVMPGGQYARYSDSAVEDPAAMDVLLELPVNVLTHYSEVTDYKDENGNPAQVQNDAGELVAPQELSIKEFIRYFRPSWADALVKFHPEYCFYRWCELTSSSRQFDETVRDEVDDALTAMGNGWWDPQDPLALLNQDPFFTTGGAGASRYDAMKDVLEHFSGTLQTSPEAGDANILQVIRFLIYCAPDSASTIQNYADCLGPADCNAGLDQDLEWQLYRTFYLQQKAKQMEQVRLAHSDPEIRDCRNCYIGYANSNCDPATDPDCTVYQQAAAITQACPGYFDDSDERKALYAAKYRLFIEEMSTDSLLAQYTSQDMQHLRDSLDAEINARVAAQCQSNCEAQADDWMVALQYCHNLVNGTDSTKYHELREGLIAVCRSGCDVNHPFGASTIAPSVTNTDSSFEAVIIRVLGAGAVNDSCTALLIHTPLPYTTDSYTETTSADSCTCDKLLALKAEYEERGGAGGFLSFLQKKFGPGFYLSQGDLNTLLKKCDAGECIPASSMPVVLPDALSCKTCVSCDSISHLIDIFKSEHPAVADGTGLYETLVTNYLNQTLHFTLTYPEYLAFLENCASIANEDNADAVACADFSLAYQHFQQFKPDYYSNPNGNTGVADRFKQHLATWLNIELNRNLSYAAYEDAAARCGIAIVVPQDSLPLVCGTPLAPGDSIYGCPPSVADCCSMDGYIRTFREAYPEGVNARLVAYYFEMKRQQWCAPMGLPAIGYRESYATLKNYFEHTLQFPRGVLIDITPTGTSITFSDSVNCGLDYNFGAAAPLIDWEVYRLCNHPLVIPVPIDSMACFKSQLNLAMVNAGLLYQQYLDSIRNEYQEIYLSRCLSVQPRLRMSGDLYEYHYTLYYYDQAGNLVKTIPPAGVQLLNDAAIGRVQQDRPYNKPECYDIVDTLSFNGGGYIPMDQLLGGRLGASWSMEQWIWIADNMADQPLFSEEIKVTAPEKYIDSTRTIPAFTGEQGISCYLHDDSLRFRIGSQPAWYPDTLFRTQSGKSSIPLSAVLPSGRWAHMVINGNGGSEQPFLVYINGRAIPLQYTTQVDTLGGAPEPEGTPEFRLGAALLDHSWHYFNGYMKQFRFYNRPLRYAEIVQNRDNTCRLPANEGGLLIWLPMNEGRDTSLLTDRMQQMQFATVNPSAFSWIRHHDPVYPLHTLATTYQYNSLNGVVQQYTPDGDTSRFWYDRLGRLTASQNKEQREPVNGGAADRYSYTKYDSLGRITEVGEKAGASIAGVNMLDNTAVQQWLASGSDAQVTRTQYDEPLPDLDIVQTNLRKRVASITLDEDGDGQYEAATHYTYDILGNVKTLWQQIKELDAIAEGQGLKRMDYDYDLVSGKVNKVSYQPGKKDQFYYRYLYDADNRVINASSSRDGLVWQKDAAYRYYLHGPLARMELGQYQVQGVDYAYTLQGWLKGINAAALDVDKDMAADGKAGSLYENFGRDVMAFTLGYHNNDYAPIGGSAAQGFDNGYAYPSTLGIGNGLYNGNISNSSLALSKLDNGAVKGYGYAYDQLNRLVQLRQHDVTSNWNVLDDYRESISYDANGNILTYLRNGTTQGARQLAMDNLSYAYQPGTNRLRHVKDAVDASNYTEDIDDQPDDNYRYDRIGNLVHDEAEGIDTIRWTVYGKIREIKKDTADIRYGYDATGNRIWKNVNGRKSFYLRDAQGNVLGLYNTSGNALVWKEQHLYGSRRLGMLQPAATDLSGTPAWEQDSLLRGARVYELSNHLGNVMATISDKKTGVSADTQKVDYFAVEVLGQQDYYPFGMREPGRRYGLGNEQEYRYGFNGKENDNEVKGEGNSLDFGERMYDVRIGRWLSLDPLMAKFPESTPYNGFGNNPIYFIDPYGLSAVQYNEDDPKQNPPPNWFTRAWRLLTHNEHTTRAEDFASLLEKNKRDGDYIQTIDVDENTTVTIHGNENDEFRLYSIFREARPGGSILESLASGGTSDDDYNLPESEFIAKFSLSSKVFDAPIGGGGLSKAGMVLSGTKKSYYVVQQGAKAVENWKKLIRFGVNHTDMLVKGFHFHFEGGLELGLKTLNNGRIGLELVGDKAFTKLQVAKAVKVFEQAMSNTDFRNKLLVRLLASREYLKNSFKLTGDAQAAINKAHELNYIIKSISKW
ncbi:RHS repeat-associated core domain-containing protein [Chitinophaga japonensis]|uniref:Uncharacterized protein RhaS with RHS repeats n=1 Tax=Chitinophaga japonensis TaxID=104662 RepID=A0A562SY13_CHIJA|nr:RHS repeat-associated core domain-containing protein [Chitinophaga japonensis]TWI86255.1 uncharacterized protein RhaS with RHS repeats [Chitinophaga japonensis]